MIDLNDYYYFVHVVEKKGFSAAAVTLDIPKSRLSRHIKSLEERLQVQLIQRTSRQFAITEIGQIFYRHARSLVDEMEQAEAAVKLNQKELSGSVNLSCSVGVAQFALKQVLLDFMIENPQILVQQHVSNQPVNLIESGIDIAVRGHMAPLPDSSLIQRHLATVQWHLFASPEYLAQKGTPASPIELIKQQTLKVGWQSKKGAWTLLHDSGKEASIPITARLCSDDMSTLKLAAEQGLGIVALPSYTCKQELAENKLQRVLPEWNAGIAELTLLTPSRKGTSPSVSALKDYLLEKVQASVT
ncbi:LysR substrate-binding domain-containing protein [Planctobacterium marinum]|uniref:LysR family transcriptional regulator n=1 Tax=Planctobacterium marinum TaxID=1631968 RepID=A0AA48HMP9_9ALTE|nr:LysR family transcriptional regulator [Planctobacterium marinum]